MSALEQGFEAQAKSLQDFGYPSVTAANVKEAHSSWKLGEDAENIIERFCFDAFDRYPQIFGQKEST